MMRTKGIVSLLVTLFLSASFAMAMDRSKTDLVDAAHAMSLNQKDIVDTAVDAGSFKTLAAALTAADLVPTLKGEGPFTVFAPTDAAFAKLPPGTVADLLKPENKSKLQAILTYHVVPGRLMASDVVSMNGAKTVNGGDLMIKSDMGKVMIDNAQITQTDIECSNGIIHVIDTVVMPK
jgi:transforming growth factor-beta-induced protein